MASQGSSRMDFFDLTEDENPSSNALPHPSGLAGPSRTRMERVPTLAIPIQGGSRTESSSTGGSAPHVAEDSDSDVEMVEVAPVDETVRQRNLQNRRERFRARGIVEEEEEPASQTRHQRRDSVAEVIIISDGEDDEVPRRLNRRTGDEDVFGEERRRRRRWNNWADELEEGPRHPNARQMSPDLFDFDFPGHLLPTAAGANAPRITLGGGGLASRNRPLQPPPSNGPGTSLHTRSLQLDGQRIHGRVRAHFDGIAREAQQEYDRVGLAGRVRNAMTRLGDVFGSLGWGAGGQDDVDDGWGPRARVGFRDAPPVSVRGRGGGGVARGGRIWGMRWDEPPEVEEDRPLDLPEAPEWKVWFTHPGKIPHGFTAEFAPVEPELIILEDSDDETKKKKGKGKARQIVPEVESKNQARDTLMLVCSLCKDPLRLNGETDDEKVYGLRCGHVLDGKCLWKLAKPNEPVPPPEPRQDIPTGPTFGTGKARTMLDSPPPRMDVDPEYQFTFIPPIPAPLPQSSNYQEDNAPRAATVHTSTTTRRQGRRGVVPIPNVSAGRRTRNRTRQNALDGVEDEYAPGGESGGPGTPQLDLTDPFFPALATNPQRGRGRARGGRGTRGRTRMRKVPKTRGRLKEEVFDWVCPVVGCGRSHVSVRLDMEGAKWKCDADKGAVLMFL